MKTLLRIASVIVCLCSVTHVLHAQIPQLINYQGRVVVGTTNFDGSGQFKFALVNAAGTSTYWSNDGTSVNASEPTSAVSLNVTNGLYSVLLGDSSIANMTTLTAGVFTHSDVRLRVWFNDGTHGSQLLAPDQRIAAVGYALMADDIKNGAITSGKLATGAVTSASIANGAIGTPQLGPGALAANFNITGTTQLAQSNSSYAATSASPTTVTIPTNANAGDVVQVAGIGTGGWSFDFTSGQQLLTRWLPRESTRVWQWVASSADGSKLVAAEHGGQIYTSTDSGVNWSPRESNRIWTSAASSADGSKLVAVVHGGQIYTSTDSGVSWSPRESNRLWQSVASSTDGSKLVAAVSTSSPLTFGQIYTSTDSGVSWSPRESNRLWQSVASSADGSKLVAVDSFAMGGFGGGQIYTSTDSGVSWSPRESNRNWRSVASSADGSKLVAVENGGQIYTSTDSGVSWSPRESNRNWVSVASSADGSKLVAVENGGQIYTSTDSGVSWTPRESNRNWFSAASSADGSKLVAVVQLGQIYTTVTTIIGTQGTNAAVEYLGNGLWQAVEASQLAANAVTSANIASKAITTANIASAAVTSTQLAANAVASGNIQNGAVTSANIASGGVATANIQNAAVTSVQLASSAVVTTNIANAAVTAAKLDPSIGVWTTTGGNVYRSAGYVGIGTNAPQRPLHIGDPSALSEAIVRFSTTATGGGAGRTWEIGVPESDSDFSDQYYSFGIRDTGLGATPQFMVQYNTGFVGIGIINPTNILHINGVGRSTSSTWATSSDARVKEDIHSLGGSLEKLKALRPVSFEYTSVYRADHPGLEGTFTGFVAQEVEHVFPEMVTTVSEKVGSETVRDFHLLNTSGLLPHVVAGMQALEAENEALRKRADELEKRLDHLEGASRKHEP